MLKLLCILINRYQHRYLMPSCCTKSDLTVASEGHRLQRLIHWSLNPVPAAYQLCDPGHVTQPLQALGGNDLIGLLGGYSLYS